MTGGDKEQIFMMWVSITYGKAKVAHGLAVHQGNNYFAKEDIEWDYLQPSAKVHIDPVQGEAKYWDIVVEGEPTLKDAAWEFVSPPSGWKNVKNRIAFRPFRAGDSGFGLKATGEADGVDMDEAWFG